MPVIVHGLGGGAGASNADLAAALPQGPERRLRTVAVLGIGCRRPALAARCAPEYSVRLGRVGAG
ncbi:hypothetical protein, partial [Streptomyces tremellae]|uniref:hypothetical protein n=1 Tax=Streptomyces tremellae TaxID=1124239 RepID=UPI0031ED5AFA